MVAVTTHGHCRKGRHGGCGSRNGWNHSRNFQEDQGEAPYVHCEWLWWLWCAVVCCGGCGGCGSCGGCGGCSVLWWLLCDVVAVLWLRCSCGVVAVLWLRCSCGVVLVVWCGVVSVVWRSVVVCFYVGCVRVVTAEA